MEQFIYLGKPLTYQNSIEEEIKSKLKSGNVCYHSVQNLLSSSLLSRALVWKPEGKRPLGRPRHGWEDNIKIDLQEVGMDWVDLAEDRDRWRALVKAVMNRRTT